METKFQTSFIPKKPIMSSESSTRVRHSVSLFMTIGVLFFIVSLAGAGFTIFWKSVLLSTQKSYQATLAKNENQFNPQLIETLRRVNTKIDVSKKLLANHLAVSSIFDIIGALTAENIKFKSLQYSGGTSASTAATAASKSAQISMQGVGTSFSAIAFQSDVFGQSSQYGRNIIIKNPVLSNLSLDQNGNVSFSFTASINPADISYKKILNQSLSGNTNSNGNDAATSDISNQ